MTAIETSHEWSKALALGLAAYVLNRLKIRPLTQTLQVTAPLATVSK